MHCGWARSATRRSRYLRRRQPRFARTRRSPAGSSVSLVVELVDDDVCRRAHVGARRLRAAALGRGITTAPGQCSSRRWRWGGPKRNVRMDCARISSRWALNSTRWASTRCVSKALSHVLPSPVARTTRPAVLPVARVASWAASASCWIGCGSGGGPTGSGRTPTTRGGGGSLRWLYASTQSASMRHTCECSNSSSNACRTSWKPLPSLLVTTRRPTGRLPACGCGRGFRRRLRSRYSIPRATRAIPGRCATREPERAASRGRLRSRTPPAASPPTREAGATAHPGGACPAPRPARLRHWRSDSARRPPATC